MRFLTRYNLLDRPWARVIATLFALAFVPMANASDLPAVGDGEHLWLIQQAPAPKDDEDAGPQLKLYHLPANTDRYIATKLDPIAGELMPRGIAAGAGKLLFINTDRQLTTIRPVWSELLRASVYQKRTLTPLPEGCTLVALTMSERGPWALVKVESRELLKQLDEHSKKRAEPTEQELFNRAMGFPDDFDWGKPKEKVDPVQPSEEDAPADENAEPQDDGQPPVEPSDTDAEVLPETETEAETETEVETGAIDEPIVEPTLPAYRLIHLRNRQWLRSPLPENFVVPREVALLIRPGDSRPTLLVDTDMGFRRTASLVRYNPVAPAEHDDDTESTDAQAPPQDAAPAPGWNRVVTGMQLPPGRRWAAGLVNDWIVVARERYRSEQAASIDTFRLRGDWVEEVGGVNVSTGINARWALLAKQNEIGLIASPAPPPAEDAPAKQLPIIAMLAGLSLEGQPMFQTTEGIPQIMPIAEKQPSILDGNADLTIQIIAFIAAMFMMVMFYRRAPEQSQLDLPEHLVLASFGRRAMAGMVDLAPGFILASLIYGVTISEILFESWPGNGVEKAFAAMRPGFVVIGVTLLHTVICEFILARSLGKIVMSMYVADLNGKPAPPAPCLGRALSRAFELFAPLMILVAIISPARQRLGDILAKTIVVMRKPEPIKFDLDDDQ